MYWEIRGDPFGEVNTEQSASGTRSPVDIQGEAFQLWQQVKGLGLGAAGQQSECTIVNSVNTLLMDKC